MNKAKKMSTVLCLLVSLLVFTTLFALIITKNETILKIDNSVAQMFFDARTRLLDYLFVIVSYMGETITIVVLCVILLLLPNRKQVGLPVVMLTVVSLVVNFVLKMIIARQRPENLFLMQDTLGYKMPDGYSFPSGHAQTANIFYFALSFSVLNTLKKKWARRLLMTFAIFFCLLMCLARIYLCVHFLTDVICGLCIMIAIFCIYILIQKHFLKINEKHMNKYKGQK